MALIKLAFKEWLAEYGVSGNMYIFVAIISFIIAGIIMRESNFYFGKVGGLLLWMLVSVIVSIPVIIVLSILTFIKANLLIISIILCALLLLYFIFLILRKQTIVKNKSME